MDQPNSDSQPASQQWPAQVLKTVLPMAFGLLMLWWIYRELNWRDVADTLRRGMNWWWMALSLMFGIVPQIMRGMRWRQALQPLGEHPRRRTCVDAIFLSYASSLIVPRIGEVARCGSLRAADGVSFSRSLGTVVTERAVDSVVMILFTAVAFVLQLPVFTTFISQTGTGLDDLLGRFTQTGYVVTLVCVLAAALTLVLLVWRLSVLRRVKGVVAGLTAGITSLRHVRHKGVYAARSLGIWVCYFLHFYLAFFCFPATAGLGFTAGIAAFCIGTFAVLVPTPNGAGPWHFAVKTVLVLYGVAPDAAIMFALVVHALQTLLVVMLGIYGWADLALAGRRSRPLTEP